MTTGDRVKALGEALAAREALHADAITQDEYDAIEDRFTSLVSPEYEAALADHVLLHRMSPSDMTELANDARGLRVLDRLLMMAPVAS